MKSWARCKRNLPFMSETTIIATSDPLGVAVSPSIPHPTLSITSYTDPKGEPAANDDDALLLMPEDARLPPRWKDTTDISKMLGLTRALEEAAAKEGHQLHAFTGNLGAAALTEFDARPVTFKRWLRNRFDIELKRLDPTPDYIMVVEFTRAPENRPHVHGLVAARQSELPAIHNALTRALTKWGRASGGRFQTDIRFAWGPAGWANYSIKEASRAQKFLGSKTAIIASNKHRTRAMQLWDRQRLTVRRKKAA